ncbi:hypothetical protein [uncultured Duncaniella sp.]|uniref:hypothetical protein n=1 Tax=uncultured Duncaniella sp. TaxID=2768039 RepID=UPI0025B6E23A|nr:hypothetical protein [uncultured Duncaniella sp.]
MDEPLTPIDRLPPIGIGGTPLTGSTSEVSIGDAAFTSETLCRSSVFLSPLLRKDFSDRSLTCRFETATLGIDCEVQSSCVGCPSQTMLVVSLSSISIRIIIEKLLSIRFPRDYVAVCFHRAGVVAPVIV